jgi:outer membrane protein OmpA-like peptidoglycan-associated protein
MFRNIALYTTALLSFWAISAFAQENPKIKKAEFRKSDDLAFQNAWDQVKKGEKYYSKGKNQFNIARKAYIIAYQYNSSNPQLNYKLGITYLYTDEKAKSLIYLQKAYSAKPNVSNDIAYMLARAYHFNYQFDSAVFYYKKFESQATRKLLSKIDPNISRRLEECNNGKVLVNQPVKVAVLNMGEPVNSQYDDYLTIPLHNGKYSFVTRRPDDNSDKKAPIDSKYLEKSYFTTIGDNNVLTVSPAEKPFLYSGNTAIIAENAQGNIRLLYVGNKGNGNISYSALKNGKWGKPKELNSKINSKYTETSASISPDGKELFFVSDREKKSKGKDIYVANIENLDKMSVGKPQPLSDIINSTYDEDAVFIANDGKTLYFSSKGFNSMGGYDVFKSVRDENGVWSKPENLGYPVNTPDDDLFYEAGPDNKVAYLSSNREGTVGLMDIYKIVINSGKELMPLRATPEILAYVTDFRTSVLHETGKKLSVGFALTGTVKDMITGKGIATRIRVINRQTGDSIPSVSSDSTGIFKFFSDDRAKFNFNISTPGYMPATDSIDLVILPEAEEYQKDFKLKAITKGSKMVLKNIFFETGKPDLKPESFPALAMLVDFMKTNPTMKLEISGHTDNVGSAAANLKLSKLRAESVVKYLISNGINNIQLTSVGYGSKKPAASNKTPTGRELNRRVEFKVLGK